MTPDTNTDIDTTVVAETPVKKHIYIDIGGELPQITYDNVTQIELIGALEASLEIVKNLYINNVMTRANLASCFNA
jgi:hypothetical protein